MGARTVHSRLLTLIILTLPWTMAPGTAAAQAKAQATAKAPSAVILFVDRTAVLRRSAVGKSVAAQVEELARRMESEFGPENQKLQADMQALQKDAPAMTPETRQETIRQLEARREAFQKKVQERQAAIQAGQNAVRTQIEKALGPILEKIMAERGANVLLDRGAVVLGSGDLDVTDLVITRLDAALPSAKVTLPATK
jgi:outer membrane protein